MTEIPHPVAAVPEQHHLQDLSEEELFQRILASGASWTDEQRGMLTSAYQQTQDYFSEDLHNDKPYVYHLLRNAARAVAYLHIDDPEILTAIILHDSVEDHPGKILAAAGHVVIPDDETVQQALALACLSERYSPRVARIVDGLTNPPRDESITWTSEERVQHYADHVEEAVNDPADGVAIWIGKITDWVDNGLATDRINVTPEQIEKLRAKYSAILPILEARYLQPDIQALLDPQARANVEHMFVLGRERLFSDEVA
jgi:hypothetical protein